jgi:hypothetical protein
VWATKNDYFLFGHDLLPHIWIVSNPHG